MNTLEERGDGLVSVDYGAILDAVRKTCKRNADKLFKVSPETGRLRVDVSPVASEVSGKSFGSPLVGPDRAARTATVNFHDGSREGRSANGRRGSTHGDFHEKVRGVRKELRDALFGASTQQGLSIEDLVAGLLVPLDSLKDRGAVEPGFGYAFPEHEEIKRRRLALLERGGSGGGSLLSLHRLTVEIDASRFEQNLAGSLENHFEQRFAYLEDEDADLFEELAGLLRHTLETDAGRKRSGLDDLRELLSEWALGIIKREAAVHYLDFLLDGVPPEKAGRERLEHLKNRMRALRDFVDDPDRPDSDYIVSYGDATRVNLREIFSQPEAFDPLPVVPQVEGALGEWRDADEGKMRYTYGMKLKLNGKVARTGDVSSLAYHAGVVDPDTDLHATMLDTGKARNIVRFAVLYAFFFDPAVGEARSPAAPLASRLIEVLGGSDMQAKRDELGRVARLLRSVQVEEGVNQLAALLRWLLEKESVLVGEPKNLHVGVARKVLEDDPEAVRESGNFFGGAFDANRKSLLKHVSVGDAGSHDWFFSAPMRLGLSNPRFGAADEGPDTHTMSYETAGMKALPVFVGLMADKSGLSPRDRKVREVYERHVFRKDHPFVLFPYGAEAGEAFETPGSDKAFLYSLVFGLLSYLTLETLLSFSTGAVYVPILRFQTRGKDDALPEESYFRSLSKTIAHLLSEYTPPGGEVARVSRSQGLVVTGEVNKYRIANAASSLYAGVPMRFGATPGNAGAGDEASAGVNKFAILAVSSWESDASWTSYRSASVGEAAPKLSCVYGEAVTLDREAGGSVLLRQFGTFASVYDERRLHQQPAALSDVVEKLYEEGYRRIAFVARSPFQSRLALTGNDERLFFLSKETLRFLRGGRNDLYLYPVFCDKYFVVKAGKSGLKANSLYIQDVGELQRVAGRGRSTIPFLHVFNGISVGTDNFYNGTLAYSVVLGAYGDELGEQATREDLIFDGRDGKRNAVKDDIVRYLTLFHFSRFEKSGRGLGFSLNPFDNLFGGTDDSVGGGSVFPHPGGSPNFNSLAFLAEAKSALLDEEPSIGERR